MTKAVPQVLPSTLPYEPLPAFAQMARVDEADLADCRGKRIGILVVAYNAVTTLRKVLQRIPPIVWRNVEEVLVADDSSPDATYELAVGLKTLCDLPKLTVLRRPENLGYGGNQKEGYRYFSEKGFDIVVLLHGDGQYAPEILAHLYHPLVTGESDAVFGSRMMKTHGGPLKGGMPLYKYVGNRILTTFENWSLGMKLTEFHSGYRAYSLHALRQIQMDRMTDDFHYDTEIIIKLQHQHFRISEVPIPTYYGDEICYVNGMRYAKDVARAVLRYERTKRSVAKYPEFSEYFVHYPIKESKYSSHYYVRQMVGTEMAVLDVGCGEGFLAEQLQKNGNRITGVDFLPQASSESALEQYFQADLNDGLSRVLRALGGKTFDRVLLLDVLEHLTQPERLLSDCGQALASHGRLVVSLPNVANITVRAMLMLGRFDYTERGILDKTHMRFFTRRTARKMMEDCGYEIVQERLTVMPLELAAGLSASNPLMILLNRTLALATKLLPGLLGYQIMFVAKKRDAQRN